MGAAVGTARVTFPMVVVMITPDIGVEVQLACCQCFCCCISVAGYTAIQLDACRCQRRLGAAANASADQCVHMQCAQDACKRAVATAVGIYHL